ncbi:pentapeptide repeat-containing protein [Moorena sp. SIO3I8]|uniref:pentapeptide repeat-containing protein n=1 Tax=Moorena sp. SIO3I8 TaxID=2607833 RepID=UPI0013C1C6BA|nr:pentapeptide repeat-containing protein [Moorena sp. SIO3I8]NEO09923.1 pentapeptide repeat-containing protein [Moorena sp. SIO3I8]
MKANKVLEKYADGKRDFRRKNLRGQSFQGEDLSGADFSEADIRGANFKNATLKGTQFCSAKAGLQKRWVIVLLLVSSITSGVFVCTSLYSGALLESIFSPSNVTSLVYTSIVLIVIIVLFAIILCRGIGGPGALVLVLASVLAFTGTGLFPLTFPIAAPVVAAITLTVAVAGAGAVAGAVAIAVVFTGAVAIAVVFTGAENFFLAFPVAVLVLLALLGTYLGWRALKGDPRDAWIRTITIAFAATGGTSFYKANLTDADFTEATLKSTDLRKATITHTCWRKTIKLNRIRPGTKYLQYENIRQLLITGQGQDKNFDRLDLRGINLKDANLQDASFIGTDLNRANLQNANFSRAKLVQTLLEGADLTRATLTGAYIEDWVISNTTKLIEIDCDYIFLKLPTKNAPDPQRRPADQERNFEPGEFTKLVQKIPNTVDLIFKDGIDWQTFLKTFQELRVRVESDTGELPVIQTIENKGDGAFVIRVKVPEEVDEAEYEQKLWAKYKPMLEAKDREIKFLSEQTEFYSEQIEYIRKDNTRLIGVVETMADKETIRIDKIDRRDQRGTKFNVGGNYVERAESVSSQQSYANQTNYEEADKNLAEAAAEIQQLMEQLSQNNPTTTSKEKMIVVSEVVDQIENNPTLKAKVVNALKAGGVEAFKETLDHPLVNILMATIEGWAEA